jgi:Ni/Co efflux regulator RcnB
MTFTKANCTLAFIIAGFITAAPAWADKPEWAGKGGGKGKHEQKHDKDQKHANKGGHQEDVKVGAYFNDHHRDAARGYYTQQYGGRKGCPPGLAKKNNGCMPPGQAKKWNVGQPLPAGVTVYTVPQPVLVQLPAVPVGYRYVRVASDILLVAVGSQMVVDGISGLMR